MKYRLRKLFDRHNPNNQKYTDFKLVGLDEKSKSFSDSDSSYVYFPFKNPNLICSARPLP